MAKKTHFLFFLTLLLCLHTGFAMTLEQLSSHLKPQTLLAGHFEQSKFLKDFPKPLKTQGEFIFWAHHGIIWSTQKPFASKLILTENRLQSITPHQQQSISVQNNPHLTLLNQLFIDLLQGNFEQLKKSFDISLDGSLQSWTLTLLPRDQVLQGMLRQVNISGRQHINYLVFKTATEDRTEILLKDQYSPKQFPQELLQ